ncbi:hypothetical protein [Chroococcidiopsis sp. CCMEE 29]|jgi:hypothetical protein|uniref:DUF6888 family protein n=1 Tax=Chroococcidiopsis sp. CCMEE 29 TaxID=155894 RepID=UPI00201FE240|nr:hypothetical protein [Chroococcidiopsis sp. CCMEE 29]
MPRLNPTVEQAFAAVRVCQLLSNYSRNIYLFRYDDTREIIYVIAGTEVDPEQIQIEIYTSGLWRSINNET